MYLSKPLGLQALNIGITGQNDARYARGIEPDGDEYNYFENYLELNTNISDFRFYFRQSFLLPAEFDSRWQFGLRSIDKKYIEYSKDDFRLRGGDFYRQWGRGLLFGTIEYVEVGFDSGLEGVLFETSSDKFEGALYKGVELDTSDQILESGEGIYLSYMFPRGVRIGLSYNLLDSLKRHDNIKRYGFEFETELGPLSLLTVYSTDKLDTSPVSYHNGFYSAATMYGAGWGIMVDYKNYKLLNYSGKLGQPSLQFPPTAIPEVTMYLLDIHPRQSHFSDDVGFQVEFNYNYGYWNATLNMNQSSEHDGNSIFPKQRQELSPYKGYYFHIEHDDYSGQRYVIQGGFHEDVEFAWTRKGGSPVWWFRRQGVGVIYENVLTRKYSISGDVQFLRSNNVKKNEIFYDEYLMLSLSRSQSYTLAGTVVFSGDTEEDGGIRSDDLRYWPSIELTQNFLDRHQFQLFYGHERGGLRCSGGFCRWVQPFEGVKLTLNTVF